MMEETMDLSALEDALPQQAAELLQELGIGSADFSQLFSVSFSDVCQLIFGLFRDGIRVPMSFCASGIGILLLLSVFLSSVSEKSKLRGMHNYLGTLMFLTVSAVPVHSAVSVATAAVKSAGGFICALIPVLAAVVAAGGNPLLSVCWNTALFSAAQTISASASGFMAPCCGLVVGTGIFSSLVPQMHLSALADKIRKTAVWVFSTLATLFTAFLSLRGILASSADSLAAKGIKLIVSSAVPVIGSQLSDAYASVIGSLSAVRSTAAVFAVFGICAVALPALVQILLWIAALKILCLSADVLENRSIGDLLRSFSSAMSILFSCVLFVTVLYVLCIGIILKVRGGV